MNKKLLVTLALVSIMMFTVAMVSPAGAYSGPQPPDWRTGGTDFLTILENIFNVAFMVLMVVAAIFLVIAGFYFITAMGDAEKIKIARNFVLWALVGVVVAVLAKALIWGVAAMFRGGNSGWF